MPCLSIQINIKLGILIIKNNLSEQLARDMYPIQEGGGRGGRIGKIGGVERVVNAELQEKQETKILHCRSGVDASSKRFYC